MTYDGTLTRGTASFASGNAKFGVGGLSGAVYNVAGSDTFLSTTPGTAGGNYKTGTIEGWVKGSSPGAVKVALGHDGWYWIGCDASGNATAHFGNPSVTEITLTTSTAIMDGAWHHVALVFVQATSVSLYVDGNRVATSASNPTIGSSTTLFLEGLASAGFDWTGALDEVRVSTVARYSGTTYTVPTAAFVSDSDTSVIYHLETDAVGSAGSPPNILPNDANIIYSPYNWDVNSGRAKTINAGAYFRAQINGSPTSITLWFDMTGVLTPLPQVTVTLDGRAISTAPIASTMVLTLPSGSTWAKRLLEVTVKSMTETQNRWATQSTAVQFQGIATSPGTCVTEPLTARKLNVPVFGDSITEGVRTLNMTATNDTDRNDATIGWAYDLREKLGAEVGVIGFGGSGVTKPSGSGGVPPLKTSLSLLWGSGPSRSFTSPAPDAIVIMDGTNDDAYDITTDYTNALNQFLAATPSTTPILALRPFNGTNKASQIQAAIAACNSPRRVTYVDTAGWWSTTDSSDNLHPYGYTNVGKISGLVAAAVRTALAKGGTYLNVGGTAKLVTPRRA